MQVGEYAVACILVLRNVEVSRRETEAMVERDILRVRVRDAGPITLDVFRGLEMLSETVYTVVIAPARS